MANYSSVARTNYVRFADVDKVRAICETADLKLTEREHEGVKEYTILSDDGFKMEIDVNGDGNEVDTLDALAACLDENQVLIFVETGREKLCYLTGFAIAINREGERRGIDLSDIVSLAAELAPAGARITSPEY